MMLTAIGPGPYVQTFEGVTPTPRHDSVPWTKVRVEESPDKTGPWTVYAEGNLTPDANPLVPQPRSFSAPGATLMTGWNRVVFLDVDLNEGPVRPVYVGATWKPEPRDVARIVRNRTFAGGGRIPDFLNETDENGPTDPSRDEVLELIDDATSDVNSKVALVIPEGSATIAHHVTALGAALLIEIGSEDFDQERFDRLQKLYDTRLEQLLDAAQDETTGGEAGDADDRLQAAGSFPPARSHIPGSEHSWDVIGKGGVEDLWSC